MVGALAFHLSSSGLEGFPFAVVKVRKRLTVLAQAGLSCRKMPGIDMRCASDRTGLLFPLCQAHQYGFETATLYGVIALYFLLNGGGPFSVDALIAGKEEDDE